MRSTPGISASRLHDARPPSPSSSRCRRAAIAKNSERLIPKRMHDWRLRGRPDQGSIVQSSSNEYNQVYPPSSFAGVARKHVVEIDGQWYAAVPRFFHTVGDHWSRIIASDRPALVTISGQEVATTTVADMDLDASFKVGGPSLVVGPEGPVYHDTSWGSGDKEDSIARRRAVTEVLMTLPGDTPVTAIDFHT